MGSSTDFYQVHKRSLFRNRELILRHERGFQSHDRYGEESAPLGLLVRKASISPMGRGGQI